MVNYRWCTSGTLDEICKELHSHYFHSKIFLIVSKGSGWYQIDEDTWLMLYTGDDWQLYYWQNCDPRPFLRIVTVLEGFK